MKSTILREVVLRNRRCLGNPTILKDIFNIFKATRAKRAIYSILSILTGAAFINKLSIDIFLLIILGFLIYSIGGLYNAKKDNDYKIKNKHYKIAIISLTIISFLISLYNYKIIVIFLAALFLAFIYNKIARYVLYLDIFIGSLTHVFLPLFGAIWVLNGPLNSYLGILIISPIIFTFLLPVKNLIGFKQDKKRGYATLMTKFKNGKLLTTLSVLFSVFLIFLSFFLFNLSYIFLIFFLIIIITTFFTVKNINSLKGKQAVILVRFIFICFFLGLILESNPSIIITLLFLAVASFFIKDVVKIIFKKS
jgi:4-hydroxybenzoate polyprenyltransferase